MGKKEVEKNDLILCTTLAPAASSSAAVEVRVASASVVVIDAVSVDIAGAKNGTKKCIIVLLGPSPLFDMHICNLHFY